MGMMTTNHEQYRSGGDRDDRLVALCLAGDRRAFEMIVERYQGLVCALTYAGCGDVHRSEDLAQETFLEAWTHLGGLKEPARLRAWLCGIARNVVAGEHRRQGRVPAAGGLVVEEAVCSSAVPPPEEAIRREEQVLLWETLERLPAEYREPLVLYYRQEESVAAVAEALELSEEAARQRLSRGRSMLAQRLEHVIDRGLRTTGPTQAFTLAVLAALPGVVVSVAATATLSAAAATTKTAASTTVVAKVLATVGGLVSMLLGPLIGLAGGYFGYRVGLAQTISEPERRHARRSFWTMMALIAGFMLVFYSTMYWTAWLGLTAHLQGMLMVGLAFAYAITVVFLAIRFARRQRRLRAAAIAETPQALAEAQAMCARWGDEYKSRWTLLGLPLIHISMAPTPDNRASVAKGWIAMGGRAYGVLFAFGGVAVGAISFGGVAIGLLTWGGCAIGAFSFGGLAVGVWALGGMAVGWQAMGGVALAWSDAVGGIAVAREYAWGATSNAAHANDPAAEHHIRGNGFFRLADVLLRHAYWFWLVSVLPLIPMLARWRRVRKNS